MDSTVGMVLLLIANIRNHPGQVLRPETNHSIPCLPFQNLPPLADNLVDFMGGGSLELPNKFANQNHRCRGDRQMDVVSCTADFVNEGVGQVDEFLFQVAMRGNFDFAGLIMGGWLWYAR